MTLREYKMLLDALIKERPEALDYQVITARDEEGNGYNTVWYGPGIGLYAEGDFTNDEVDPKDYNAVCLN